MLDGRGLRLATEDGQAAAAAPLTGAAPAHLAEPFDPWRLFRLLRRQAWTFLGVVVAVNLLTALALWQITPIYKASALVIVAPWQRSMLDADRTGSGRPADAARVESEVEILRSPSVLLAVVDKLDLARDPEFAPRAGLRARLAGLVGLGTAPPSAEQATRLTLKRLGIAVAVTRRGATYVIEVAARSKDPDKAARIANALAAAYIDAQIRAKVDFAADVQKRLAQQLDSARAALREMDRKLDSFLDDSIVEIESPELRAELTEIRSAIREQEANRLRYDALAGRSRERARKREWDALIAELNSDRMVRLNAQLAAIQQGLEPVESADTAAKLAQLDRQIDKEAQAVIARIAAEASAAEQSEAELRTRLSQRLAGPDVPADIVLLFREVEGDAAALRLVVDTLTTNSTAATAEIDLQLPDSRIVSAALPPSTPDYPDTPLIITLALALSVVLGLAVAILRDHLAGGFSDEGALEAFSGVPVLATLPAIETRADRPGEKPANEILEHPGAAYAESVRRLRLGLDLAPAVPRPQETARVVLVTAALAGEGATLTAIALARSFALSGRRTLLIDGNLRQPGIHTALDVERRQGLADHLAGRVAATRPSDDFPFDDITPHLAIAAGPGDARLKIDTLLQSGRLGHWLQTVRQTYDLIVIDSPAVLPVIDALLWIRHADDILMMVDATTSPRELRAALRALARGGRGTAHLWLTLNHASCRAISR
ncbi:MAG: Wzz/FepE/Etk N-terminal domain-containing protein [Candidatus Kaistia colombiensis]|nr:MAG: Wzz/FepE/Etk N-terminal domain-containing protein [Kaistia sp.]